MNPFNSFDFTQTPDLSVLDNLLQNQLGLLNSANHSSGCFIPLPAQTGIGKTHTACALMLERILLNIKNSLDGTNASETLLTYYITNSTDNVQNGFNGLERLIDRQMIHGAPRFNNDQKAHLKSQIVHLHAQNNQLLQLSGEDREHILAAFRLNNVTEIREAFFELDSLEKVSAHNRVVAKRMKEFARKTYLLLKDHIRRTIANHETVLSEAQQEAVYRLFPGEKVLQGKACVLFMTTKKFMYGFHTTTSRIDPIEHLSNSLLIIDEVDRQNAEILTVLSEAKAVDLVEFGKRVSANFSHHVLENSHRYNGVMELLEPLLHRSQEHAKTWHMKYHFMLEGSSLNEHPVRLFSDRSITHAHSAVHFLSIHTDHARQKNIIVAKDKPSLDAEASSGALSRFVNESDWLFREFTRVFQWSAHRITQNETANIKALVDRHNQYLGAVTSLLVHFGLEAYKPIVLDIFSARFRTLGHHRPRLAMRSYHDTGLKFTEVARIQDASDTMSCFYKSLSITPTGLLAQMVDSGAAILGISATANSPTVIHNFDQEYLRTRLGPRYILLSKEQQKQLGDYYTSRRRYQAANITTSCHYIRPQVDIVTDVITMHEGHPPRDTAFALSALVKISAAGDFGLQWFSKLLNAMDVFVRHPHCRYMLALLNRTLDAQPTFISTLEAYLSLKSNQPVKVFAGINAEAMKDGRYEEAQNHLSTTLDKVILISTYQTMGEGKNPDYLVTQDDDLRSLIWVGDGEQQGECRGDIDAIYLEKPTNMLLTNPDSKVSLIVMLHQIMSLKNTGYISHNESKKWIHRVLTGADSMFNTQRYNQTDDSPWATRRVIQQAIGRMARTAYKRPEILLMCDSDLTITLGKDDSSSEILSHEYAALRDFCKSALTEPATPTSAPQRRQRNLAHLYTLNTLALIDELLRGIFTGNENSIKEWQDLRLRLLRQPTISEISGDCPQLYLQASKPSYGFSGNLDALTRRNNQPERNLKLFEEAFMPSMVGEHECQLPLMMRNTVIQRHFIANGFATYWSNQPWVMTPGAYQNIYKGALGEEAIKALLIAAELTLEELPTEAYERFDFIAKNKQGLRIAIDAKHWASGGEAHNHAQKIELIKAHCNVHHFAIINLIGRAESTVEYVDDELKPSQDSRYTTLIIPGLIDVITGATLDQNLAPLLTWTGAMK